MRKTIFTLGLMLAAALSLTNCTKNEEATFTPEVKVPFELYANMDDTRTTNDGIHTNWAANDEINVFHAVAVGFIYAYYLKVGCKIQYISVNYRTMISPSIYF